MANFQEYKVFANPEEIAEYTGRLWQELQDRYTKEGLFYLSSPLSSTPLPLYKWVIENARSFPNWKQFCFILMDEQVEGNPQSGFSYVSPENPASYERFARKNLLESLQQEDCFLNLDDVILKPNLTNLPAFDSFLRDHGGIDLLILAIGAKGHYAQVMPGTSFETGFHVAKLIPEFIQAHTGQGKLYEGAEFNQYGMSLGPQEVLGAKNIIVMVMGKNKRSLVQELLSYSEFNPEFPLSIVYRPEVISKTQVLLSKEVAV